MPRPQVDEEFGAGTAERVCSDPQAAASFLSDPPPPHQDLPLPLSPYQTAATEDDGDGTVAPWDPPHGAAPPPDPRRGIPSRPPPPPLKLLLPVFTLGDIRQNATVRPTLSPSPMFTKHSPDICTAAIKQEPWMHCPPLVHCLRQSPLTGISKVLQDDREQAVLGRLDGSVNTA